jgi:hypothetical protein
MSHIARLLVTLGKLAPRDCIDRTENSSAILIKAPGQITHKSLINKPLLQFGFGSQKILFYPM